MTSKYLFKLRFSKNTPENRRSTLTCPPQWTQNTKLGEEGKIQQAVIRAEFFS